MNLSAVNELRGRCSPWVCWTLCAVAAPLKSQESPEEQSLPFPCGALRAGCLGLAHTEEQKSAQKHRCALGMVVETAQEASPWQAQPGTPSPLFIVLAALVPTSFPGTTFGFASADVL